MGIIALIVIGLFAAAAAVILVVNAFSAFLPKMLSCANCPHAVKGQALDEACIECHKLEGYGTL